MSKPDHTFTMSPAPSPTRRAVLSVGAATVAASVLPQAAHAGNPWAPTELGLELMRRLPAYAEATCVRVRLCDCEGHPEYDAEKVEAADAAEDATSARVDEMADAILDRPVTELSHLTDLAIITRVFDEDRRAGPASDLGEEATSAMVDAILRLAGVPESESSMTAVYKRVERARAAAA